MLHYLSSKGDGLYRYITLQAIQYGDATYCTWLCYDCGMPLQYITLPNMVTSLFRHAVAAWRGQWKCPARALSTADIAPGSGIAAFPVANFRLPHHAGPGTVMATHIGAPLAATIPPSCKGRVCNKSGLGLRVT